jgi:hypothetical protein
MSTQSVYFVGTLCIFIGLLLLFYNMYLILNVIYVVCMCCSLRNVLFTALYDCKITGKYSVMSKDLLCKADFDCQ